MLDKLQDYKKQIDTDLAQSTSNWRQTCEAEYTAATLTVLDSLIDFISRGGKRVRGALAMESYYLHGGNSEKTALGAARVMELVQASLLTMDDIQDKSESRRGGKTVHVMLADKNDSHYGVAQGLNAEMLASQKAMIELMELPVDDSYKVRAAKLLSQDIAVTIAGQINDIYNQTAREKIDQDAIIKTLTWKTAYYTFVSPLELGACLAGEHKLSDRLREYALNAGVAFQISDDILGVFGNSFESGKSANDDIREGKATLLVAHAYSRASSAQKVVLGKILGKSDATNNECDQVREVFEKTGARVYALQTAERYRKQAEVALGKNPEKFLIELVRFAVNRTA